MEEMGWKLKEFRLSMQIQTSFLILRMFRIMERKGEIDPVKEST